MLTQSLSRLFARRWSLWFASRLTRRSRRRRFQATERLEERLVLSGAAPTLENFLTTQHVDLNLRHSFSANSWALGFRDDDAFPAVQYTSENALVYVGTQALSTRPASGDFDFVGVGSGQSYYRLPQTQNPDLAYLGIAGYGVTPGDVDQYNPSTESKGRVSGNGRWLRLNLVGVDHTTPAGDAGTGKFSIWQNGESGPAVFASNFNDGVSNANSSGLDATDGLSADDSVWILANGHLHFNYGFSEPGRYALTFRMSGYFGSDGNNATPNVAGFRESEPITIYVSVRSVGQLELDAASYAVNESAGTASITVHRTGGSDGQITVDYATANGSATVGDDFEAASGTLTFLDGQTTAMITIPLVDDLLEEGDETVQISLSNPGPASIADYVASTSGDNSSLLGALTSAVLTIIDNDNAAQPPVATNDSFRVSAGAILVGNVLFNDSSPNSLALSALLDQAPAHGTVTLRADGSFQYIPGLTFNGTDSFTYVLDDGSATAIGTVTVTLPVAPHFTAYQTIEHTDVGIAYEEGWDLHIHDEWNDVEREPGETLLYVGPSAQSTRPANPAFDFIGVGAGASYYRLPESANPELLFLGIGAEEIVAGTFTEGSVKLRLKSVSGPGQFSLWQSGEEGPLVLMSSADGLTEGDQINVLEGGHEHANWGFTAAGYYQVVLEAFGTLPEGGQISSGDVTYHFGVDVAIPAAPILTVSAGAQSYTENAVPKVVTTAATVTDADSVNFAGGQLTVAIAENAHPDDRLRVRNQGTGTAQVGLDGANALFQGVVIGTVAGGFVDNSPLAVSLNASATPAAVAALIRNITFDNTGDDPTSHSRLVSFQLTDGTGRWSEPVTRVMNVTAVNDAPVVTTSPGTAFYAENQSAVVVDSGLLVTDVDSHDLDLGSLRASVGSGKNSADRLSIISQGAGPGQIGLDGENVLFEGTVIGTVSGGFTTSSLTVTFNSSATVEAAQALGRAIAFHNAGDNPTTANRSINFAVKDGDGKTSLTASRQVEVSVANDAPVVSIATTTGNYRENAAPVAVNSGGKVSDPDSATFEAGVLTVAITAGAGAEDRLRIRNDGTALNKIGIDAGQVTFSGIVIGEYFGGFTDNSPLVVSFNGNATLRAVSALVKAITFEATGDAPTGGVRTIEFRVSDGDGGTSNPVSRNINVTPVNDVPVLTLGAETTSYTEGSTPVSIDTLAALADVDSPDFAGGLLTVAIGTGKTTSDRLSILDLGIGSGQIGLSGSSVLYAGNAIGTFTGGFTANTSLNITLNSNATPAAVQALLRAIAFRVQGSITANSARTITFKLSDGDGGTSTTVSKTLEVLNT